MSWRLDSNFVYGNCTPVGDWRAPQHKFLWMWATAKREGDDRHLAEFNHRLQWSLEQVGLHSVALKKLSI